MPDFSAFSREGDIRPVRRDERQILATLAGANDSVAAAQALLAAEHFGAARDNAYEAMLKAGLALMLHHGYRPQSVGRHVTVVRFAKEVLGRRCGELLATFDRLRRKRNDRLYEARGLASRSEAAEALGAAERLMSMVREETGAEAEFP